MYPFGHLMRRTGAVIVCNSATLPNYDRAIDLGISPDGSLFLIARFPPSAIRLVLRLGRSLKG
jgi:hypothetical protein